MRILTDISDEEDDDDGYKRFVGRETVNIRLGRKPYVSYDFLMLDEPQGFCSPQFTIQLYQNYFRRIKRFTQKTIKELFEINYAERFKINDGNRGDKKLLSFLEGELKKRLTPTQQPLFGHFHLFDKKELEKFHETGNTQLCPVVHFFICESIFYIFLFDPFHDIHPTKS